MRFSTALTVFALFAASASALHPRQAPPTCTNDCYAKLDFGSCKQGDNTCLCKSDSFVQGTFQCIEAACSGQDLHDAIASAAGLCAAAGVVLPSAAGAEFSATASLGSSSSPSAAQTNSASNTAAASPSPSTTTNGALSASANTAFLGLAAIGALALAL